jgi:hypothetical protein
MGGGMYKYIFGALGILTIMWGGGFLYLYIAEARRTRKFNNGISKKINDSQDEEQELGI